MAALAGSSACSKGEPPAWDGGSLSVAPLPVLPPSAFSHALDAAVDSAADAGPAVDPGTLPQTRERPREGPAFQARAAVLWNAIVKDDADLALPFFFPVEAYKRDIHHLHEKLGSRADSAKLVELEVATERARWVEPGEEVNKLGYWRVFGSKLRYETDRGAAAMDVTSLISWRGEWYVVHLGGFK
jgi:hypothetical protein